MGPICEILWASSDADYVDPSFLRAWADELIKSSGCPQLWLIRLSTCSTKEAVTQVFQDCIRESGRVLDSRFYELVLGFLYLAEQEGKIDFEKLVQEVIEIVDTTQLGPVSVEAVLKNPEDAVQRFNVEEVVLAWLEGLSKKCSVLFNDIQRDEFLEREKAQFEQ